MGANTITSIRAFGISDSTSIAYHWMARSFVVAQATFQVSVDRVVWNTLKTYTQEDQDWVFESDIDLSEYVGQRVFVRFKTDLMVPFDSPEGSISDDTGFFFDDLVVAHAADVVWSTIDDNIDDRLIAIDGKPDGTYYYRVRAFRDAEWWGWSNINTIVIDGDTPQPSEPSSDFDGDGRVSFNDFLLFVQSFGTRQGDPGFHEQFELSQDGKVGFEDFLLFVQNFGKALDSKPAERSEKGL